MPEPARQADTHRARFREIARIRDTVEPELGLFAVITERESDGKISFCVFRGFERIVDSQVSRERSTYLGKKHIPGVHRLLKEVDRRLVELEEQARGQRRAAGEP